MSKKTIILVAVAALAGGIIDPKTKAKVDAAVNPGDELTEARIAALGLSDEDIADLIARGHIAEVDARVAELPEAADLAALESQLAEETKRANDAEAKVKDLETQLAAAKAPKTAGGPQA